METGDLKRRNIRRCDRASLNDAGILENRVYSFLNQKEKKRLKRAAFHSLDIKRDI